MPSYSDRHIQTPRLLLRPLEPSDAPALLAVFGDPAVMRYWSTPPWTSADDALAMIARAREAAAAGTAVRFGIVRAADGALIGTCTLFDRVAESRRAEVGYALARAAWGQGYAREAVAALLDHAFGVLGLHRVEADIDPRNAASARLLERLGFRREGLLRERWIVGGEVTDSAIYGLLARDWAGAGAQRAVAG